MCYISTTLINFSGSISNLNIFNSGIIGMALSYGLSLNASLVFSIQNQSTLANYMISVERVNQYMHIQSEAEEIVEDYRPPLNWPVAGEVEIDDLKVIHISF
jgi:ATP-binding cassette subfamily C (CFTR/MRP) protein 2